MFLILQNKNGFFIKHVNNLSKIQFTFLCFQKITRVILKMGYYKLALFCERTGFILDLRLGTPYHIDRHIKNYRGLLAV